MTVKDQVAGGQGIIMDVNYPGTVTIGAWNVRHLSGILTVNINGVPDITITTTSDKWRFGDSATSTLNIDGNPSIVANGIRGADSDDGTFTLNMTGGTLHLLDEFSIGDNGGGEININGGSLIVDNDIALGDKRGVAPITVNMTDGLIRTGQLQLPSNKDRAGVVRVNLYGGALNCGELVHGSYVDEVWSETDDWRLDIEQGTLEIGGDVRDEIDANVTAGQITAYDGDGEVVITLVGPNTVVTALPPDPLTATKPYPSIGSDNVDPNVVMHWTPGITANTHDVYFGTSFDDVNDATTSSGVFEGNQGPNTFDPCGAGVPLEYLTTYYWRIDEVEVGGVVKHKGRVWYFTTGTVIIDPNMIAYYMFDETESSIAADSSGFAHHASIYVRDNQPPYWDPNGYDDSGCLSFHKLTEPGEGRGVTSVQPPAGTLSSIDSNITFAVWLRESWNHEVEYGETPHNWVFDAGTGGSGGQYHVMAAVPLDDEKHVYWRAGNDVNDALEWDLDGGSARDLIGWRHWAFVKDEGQDTMTIYLDGSPVKSKSGVNNTLANISDAPFKIGATTWVNYDYAGYMDDFRVYNRALSADEIRRIVRTNPELAWAPDPYDGQTDVPRDANLIWKPGDFAAEHDVYLGTDYDDVNDANTNSDVYKGRQSPNQFDPTLEMDTTYYWRIDEVNDPCVWKGNIWRFTVASFLIIDDFESYDSGGNPIYYTWEDGYVNDTGSVVDLGTEPFDPAHGGVQSMEYVYDNRDDWWGVGYYSEAKLPFDPAEDWTEGGMKLLTLFFYGDPDNDVEDTEQLYVGLEGSLADVNYTDDAGKDMNDLKNAEWMDWNVALSDFAGVDPCAVTGFLIGFGERGGQAAGGWGVAYFDDIRLYPSRCVPEYGPAADLSDNCIVDWADVQIMASDWLDADSVPVEVPSPGPAGHWEFEGNADDSSGNGNHGTAEGTYAYVGGRIGTDAIEFSGEGGKVLVPDAPELRPASELTVAAWVNTSATLAIQARVVSKGLNADDRDNFGLTVNEDNHAGFYVRDSNEDIYYVNTDEELTPGEWHHIAGSYDGSSLNCYVNGRREDTDEIGVPTLLQDTNDLVIGNMADADRAYIGKVDDVQFYDYALSDAQVAHIGTEGTGDIPITSEANLYDLEPVGQKAVNIRDFGEIAASWLQQKFWPE
jgi:hypothetical protein